MVLRKSINNVTQTLRWGENLVFQTSPMSKSNRKPKKYPPLFFVKFHSREFFEIFPNCFVWFNRYPGMTFLRSSFYRLSFLFFQCLLCIKCYRFKKKDVVNIFPIAEQSGQSTDFLWRWLTRLLPGPVEQISVSEESENSHGRGHGEKAGTWARKARLLERSNQIFRPGGTSLRQVSKLELSGNVPQQVGIILFDMINCPTVGRFLFMYFLSYPAWQLTTKKRMWNVTALTSWYDGSGSDNYLTEKPSSMKLSSSLCPSERETSPRKGQRLKNCEKQRIV